MSRLRIRSVVSSGLSWLMVAGCLSLLGCNGGQQPSESGDQPAHAPSEVFGGRVYGGTLRISEVQGATTLFPASITDVGSVHLASQIYEGLVRFDPQDLSVQPGVAESWKIDTSGMVYTFALKKGVFFHNDPCFPEGKGRELTARDVEYSLRVLCSPSPDNLLFSSTLKEQLLGADAFYKGILTGMDPDSLQLTGVHVVDDHTVELRLARPHFSFIYTLAQSPLSIIPREAVEAYGTEARIGTGPFMLPKDQTLNGEQITLVRNPNYHGKDTLGNQLPFLDSLVIHIYDTRNASLVEIIEDQFHIINQLPSETITKLIKEDLTDFSGGNPKFIVARQDEMGTHYYQLNLTVPILQDQEVRQAMNYAIDRRKIIEEILKGDAMGPGFHGITPPSYKGYNTEEIFGYHHDPVKARQLLAAAGYPGGEGFPVLELKINDNGFKNTSVAIEIQNQLREVLGIHIDIEVIPFRDKLSDMRLAKGDIFRTTWLADYPSPESFLSLFYGRNVPETTDIPSFPNSTRYVNREFDQLFEKAMRARTRDESFGYLKRAEQILMDDAPLIVLWYQENYKLKHASVQNYFTNALDIPDYREVYFGAPKGKK